MKKPNAAAEDKRHAERLCADVGPLRAREMEAHELRIGAGP